MRTPRWIAAAFASMLVLIVLVLAPSRCSGDTALKAARTSVAVDVGAGVEERDVTGDAQVHPSRTVAAGADAAAPVMSAGVAALTDVSFSIVDASDCAVSGATIRLSRSGSGGFELLCDIAEATRSDSHVLEADDNGTARTAVTRDLDYSYVVTAQHYEPSRGSVAGGEHRRVQLTQLLPLSVSVQSSSDLRQFPQLKVSAIRHAPFERRTFMIDDGNGELTIYLPVGEWSLRAESTNAYSNTRTVGLSATGSAPPRVVLELEAAAVHTGLVLEAGTGAPIAGAHIAWHIDLRNAAITDASGHFEIAQPDGDWSRFAFCTGVLGDLPGHARLSVRLTEPFTLIELSRARQCSGRVLTADGARVPGALVVAVVYDRGHGQRLESIRTTSDERGEWSLGELRDGDVYWFAAMAAEHGPAFEFRQIDEACAAIDLALTAPATLVGRLTPTDEGMHDGAVRLRLLDAPTKAIFLRRPVVLERHLTDRELPLVQNRFLGEGLRPGRYELRYIGAHGAITKAQVQLSAGRNSIDLHEHRALTISGTLRVTGGAPSPKHRYMVVLEGSDSAGNFVRRGTRLLPNQFEYRFGGVETGSYQVRGIALGLSGASSTATAAVGGDRDLGITIDIAGATATRPQAGGVVR